MTKRDIIKFRRGTAAEWAASEPQPGGEVLRLGEPGWEKDTGKLKIGDGITSWNSLPYLTEVGGEDVILQPQDVEEVIASVLTEGNNIDLVWDDPSDTLTVGTVADPTFDKIQLDTTADPTLTEGQIGWDAAEGTMDLSLEGDINIHIGEHNFFRIRNETANTIYSGQAVYASDVHNNILIEATPYIADGSIREIRFIGLVLEDVPKNQKGYAINFGHIENLDTRGNGATNGAQNLYAADEPAWVEGDILYVHPTIPGKLTKVEPKHSIAAAIVLYVHQNNGRIFVRPTSYGHLDDNHDVDLTNLEDNNLLVYNGGTQNWEPSSNLTFDGTTLRLVADGDIANFRFNQYDDSSGEPCRMIFRRMGGSQSSPTIAPSGAPIYAIRGESYDYSDSTIIVGGLRMEIVDPASPTSLYPSTRIFLRNSSGGDNLLDKSCFFNPDGSFVNGGSITGTSFSQPNSNANVLNGSVQINGGLSAPIKILNLNTVSGNVSISYSIDKQIQTLVLDGTATNFIEGTSWPSSDSVDVLLEIFVSSTTSVTWSIVDDWYNPVPSFVPGKYLVLLRNIGLTIQGHYIGEKTN
jgi:hypothetical protein